MRYFYCVSFLVCSVTLLRAQNFIGLQLSNYAGVHSLQFNPAFNADSRMIIDVNIGSAGIFANNDYYYLPKDSADFFAISGNINKVLNGSVSENIKAPSQTHSLAIAQNMLLPSAVYSIDNKQSVGLYFQLRSAFGGSDFPAHMLYLFKHSFKDDEVQNKTYTYTDVNFSYMVWMDRGVNYSRVLHNKDDKVWKVGANLRLINAFAGAYIRNANFDMIIKNDSLMDITSRTFEYGRVDYDKIDDATGLKFGKRKVGSGFGIDLGAVYEWREPEAAWNTDAKGRTLLPQSCNKYKLRIGLALLDIGNVKFSKYSAVVKIDNATAKNVYYDDINLNSSASMDSAFSVYFYKNATQSTVANSFSIALPTAINLTVDYHLHKKFYASVSLLKDLKLGSNPRTRANQYLAITPRYENRWIEVALPINFSEFQQTNLGIFMRLGPLFFGSDKLGSLIGATNMYGLDYYGGLKVPIYYKALAK